VIASIALRMGACPFLVPHVAYPREAPPIC
jgi:hypothetical protein